MKRLLAILLLFLAPGARAAVSISNIYTNGIDTSTSTTVSVTSVNAANGTLVAVAANFGQTTTGTLVKPTIGAVTGLSAWTERAYVAMSGTSPTWGHAIVWTASSTGVTGVTITVTENDTNSKSGIVAVYVLAGWDTTTPVGGTATKDSNGTSDTIDLTINVQQVGSVLLGSFQNGNGTTFTTRSDTTKDGITYADGSTGGVAAAHLTSTTSGTGNTVFGFTNSDTFTLNAGIEVRPSGGATCTEMGMMGWWGCY